MEKENTNYFQPESSKEKDLYMETLKHNIERYMSFSGCTMKELAETANIPFATLNNLLYSKTHKDCKLSTVINLAKAMEVTIDELLGGITLPEDSRLISTMRTLPKRIKYMIHWFLEYQIKLAETYNFNKQQIINVMYPTVKSSDCLLPSEDFRPLDISSYPMSTKTKVFLGIYISCDYYMPLYCPYDILLIANDRPARPNEICVIIYYGHLYLAKRQEIQENGVNTVQFASLRDGLVRATEAEVEMVIGYVADVYHDLK